MRACVQRVTRASVTVNDERIAEIGPGLLVLLGVARDDGEKQVTYLADKLAGLRIMEDEHGKMNRSVRDTQRSVLVVSQFTLLGDCRKGRRPSFVAAAPPEQAESLYERFVESLRSLGLNVATGLFRTDMQVELVNDGPVTLLVET